MEAPIWAVHDSERPWQTTLTVTLHLLSPFKRTKCCSQTVYRPSAPCYHFWSANQVMGFCWEGRFTASLRMIGELKSGTEALERF